MARTRTPVFPVETRKIIEQREPEPPAPDDGDAELAEMFNAAPQITGKMPMVPKFIKVTPAMARRWLTRSEKDDKFQQRPTRPADVRRWALLMESDRFIQYLPDGPICLDDDGVLLNGKHRMTALAGQNKSLGLMIIEGVPRWMFAYFDTGRNRTLKDVFTIAGKMTHSQTGSTMRLAMRYEEMIRGLRKQIGWREWGKVRDEHADVLLFEDRREPLTELYMPAARGYTKCRLVIASLMCWRFYQTLAWPEGGAEINTYWEQVTEGVGHSITTTAPAYQLREWAKDLFSTKERINGKRELHLLLLFRHFDAHVRKQRMSKVSWAFGFNMPVPFHPKGPEAAVQNVLAAMAKMDADAGL